MDHNIDHIDRGPNTRCRHFPRPKWPVGLWITLFCIIFVTLPALAEYGDVVINNRSEQEGMRPVVYPHWFHRMRFRCKVCHGELGFKMRAGANDISMADLTEGRFCGMCHNEDTAWGLQNCHRCHSGMPGSETKIHGADKSTGPGMY